MLTALKQPLRHSDFLIQSETFAICAFAFVLPQFEVPKNALWILYVLLWVTNRWRRGDFGGSWDRWDSLLAIWIASGYASALFAGLHDSEWKSAIDLARYGILLSLLRRSAYDEDVLRRILQWLVIGTLFGLLRGYYELHYVPRPDLQPRNLGLNSVGHVNHSAIYLSITFGATLAWVRGAWRSDSNRHRTIGLAICVGFALSLFVMASRATVAVSLLVGFVLLATYAFRSGKRIWRVLAGAFLAIVLLMVVRPEVVEKNALRMKEHNVLAHRDNIWRTGLEGWRNFPFWGVGMGNYGRINQTRLEQWRAARGKSFDPSRFLPQAHAHNLYINTLVERGAVGLAVLLIVLAAWLACLLRGVPATNDPPIWWAYWGGALGAWIVAVVVGFVNTTLHHEHALSSMLLLGGWLALKRIRMQPA